MATTRVLILSWEYPPLVEGGLARHVRKLSEQLVRRDVEVHVLTRGDGADARATRRSTASTSTACASRASRATSTSSSTWIEQMNGDMLAAGLELGERLTFDLVHGHDWLVAAAGDELARRSTARGS